ncbi:MAG: flagellar biosynthetic protein FliO, partial [Treponemataceae bacterium]|nr:flagellar biosynthetic protein FliO [Treponemataceae bacterium]
ILVLAVVIACIYGVMWFMKRSMKADAGGDPFLRRVASIGLGTGKSVQIVTLIDRAYILGVSDGSVSLIGEVSDKELVDSMNLYADRQSDVKKPRSFADILDIFMPGGPRGTGGAFEGSDARAADLLKRQRERMNGGV